MQPSQQASKRAPYLYHTPGFFLILCGEDEDYVAIRKTDFKVNATHIAKMQRLYNRGIPKSWTVRKDIAFERVMGKNAGQFIAFTDALKLCSGLPLVAQNLRSVYEKYHEPGQDRRMSNGKVGAYIVLYLRPG